MNFQENPLTNEQNVNYVNPIRGSIEKSFHTAYPS